MYMWITFVRAPIDTYAMAVLSGAISGLWSCLSDVAAADILPCLSMRCLR